MDLNTISEALTDIANSDEPTTKKAAGKLAAGLADHLAELRGFVDDLDSALTETETAAESLIDADGDDRAGCHAELAGAAAELQDQLAVLLTPST